MWEVPLGAEVIAFSDKTGVEMFTIGDHIMGVQGHPEYTKDILCNLIDRLLNNDAIEVIITYSLLFFIFHSHYHHHHTHS